MRAVAPDVPRLVAVVTGLDVVGTVAGQVSRSVALVACLAVAARVRAVAGDVARLVADVARRAVGALLAVLGKMALAVATVTPVSLHKEMIYNNWFFYIDLYAHIFT